MLLTRRLERARLRPLGFVANEYALAVWGLGDVAQRIRRGELSLADLFDECVRRKLVSPDHFASDVHIATDANCSAME